MLLNSFMEGIEGATCVRHTKPRVWHVGIGKCLQVKDQEPGQACGCSIEADRRQVDARLCLKRLARHPIAGIVA